MTDVSSSLIAPLPDHALIAATGADAAAFLHGQLTNDVTGLGPHAARLAGYCTAKGRLLATMVFWHAAPAEPDAPPTLLLLVRRDGAEALIKRLRMFVLRAKVAFTLTDLPVHGVQAADAAAGQALAQALGAAPGSLPWQKTELANGTWISAPSPAPAVARWWWIGRPGTESDAAGKLAAGLAWQDGTAVQWHAADLAAGLPWIGAQTQDLFIPQTVNLDLIEGVSFSKGCYPGQEVVARSHYRGTVKRRMALGTLSAAVPAAEPGADIYDARQAGEPCGRIVDAAERTVLFEAPLDAVEGGDLRLGAPDGPAIAPRALPYRAPNPA